MMKVRSLYLLLTLGCSVSAFAVPLQSDGVAGEADRKDRSPILSVSTEFVGTGVRIAADVAQQNEEFQKFPMTVEFFVNRQLLATQIRSPELPGPLGVDVGADVASPPFNYSVVAKVIHPNRTFTSVIQGAVERLDLGTVFASCTLTIDSNAIVATTVETTQDRTDHLTLSGVNGDLEEFTAELTVTSAGVVTGTVVSEDVTYQLSGTATIRDNALVAFDASSPDGETLSCR